MRKVLFIFGQLTDEDVDWLARVGRVEKLDAGTTIIQRGREVENIYIVLEGSFSVFYTEDFSKPEATLYAGEIVGEMSFIDARPPSATVRSDGGAMVLKIPKSELQRRLDVDTGLAARFYRSTSMLLSARLRALSQSLARLQGRAADADEGAEDELDPNVLDGVSLAGDRFDRMVRAVRGKGL